MELKLPNQFEEQNLYFSIDDTSEAFTTNESREYTIEPYFPLSVYMKTSDRVVYWLCVWGGYKYILQTGNKWFVYAYSHVPYTKKSVARALDKPLCYWMLLLE